MKWGNEYHAPVLLHECVEGLALRPDGCYVDVTFGGGGHSRAILAQLGPQGRLIAFDRDADARRNVPDDPRFTLVPADFRWIGHYLRYLGEVPVDGILADLGVSSHQFDTMARGFSFRGDGPLDMRMDRSAGRSAAELVNTADDRELATVLGRYGEVQGAHRVARCLLQARSVRAIRSTGDLVDALRPVTPRADANGFLAQVFQALRIAVNDELGALEGLLANGTELLAPGGRLVVISYHSLEDRLVKHWMRAGNVDGEEVKDLYGRGQRPLDPLNTKAVKPSPEEVQENPRARSARLRIAEKNKRP